MSEISCDNYMTATVNIKNLCEQSTTTLTQLQNAVSALQLASLQIDDDVDTMMVPSTTTHLTKLILTLITKVRNIDLQHAVNDLIKRRHNFIDEYALLHTYDETATFSLETKNIIDYVGNLENSCSCMKYRKDIIEK